MRTLFTVPSCVQIYLWIKDTSLYRTAGQLSPNGVRYREVPIYLCLWNFAIQDIMHSAIHIRRCGPHFPTRNLQIGDGELEISHFGFICRTLQLPVLPYQLYIVSNCRSICTWSHPKTERLCRKHSRSSKGDLHQIIPPCRAHVLSLEDQFWASNTLQSLRAKCVSAIFICIVSQRKQPLSKVVNNDIYQLTIHKSFYRPGLCLF